MTSSHQSVNPSTGKLLKSFEPQTSAQLEKPLAAAKSGFQSWKH
jgi:succinate-semialdehyde dehydrogenase/glutarate-semialdehyde dehydrogenase